MDYVSYGICLLHNVQTGSRAHSGLLFTGYSCSSLGVQQLWHEVGHSPLSGAEVKPFEA